MWVTKRGGNIDFEEFKKKKEKYLDKIINNIIDLINDKLTDYNEDIQPNIIILKSCNESKLSSHIIYQNVVFDDVYHIRYFIIKNKFLSRIFFFYFKLFYLSN